MAWFSASRWSSPLVRSSYKSIKILFPRVGVCLESLSWSATHGAVALSSAEAEFYAMIERVRRAKGLNNLAEELGFANLSNIVRLGTDSSAAKSFVCRRGLGKMRHLEIRDLWLQKEVMEGRLEVSKIRGDENRLESLKNGHFTKIAK